MMKEIQVLTRAKKTIVEEVKETINLEYPTQDKFYKRNDDGAFFARGVILFGILVKYSTTFLLFEVERGKQFYTDFVPTKDCRQDYWLSDTNDIRRTALEIMLGKDRDFVEITKEEFIAERELLLNQPFDEDFF